MVRAHRRPRIARASRTLSHGLAPHPRDRPRAASDLPPLDEFDDPAARAKFAKKANPSLTKQQGTSFYAVTIYDNASIQKMDQAGWELTTLADGAGKTLLHRSAQVGNAPVMELLLKKGAAVDATTRWRETALHMAVRNGRLPCVKLLVEAGASLTMETQAKDNALSLARKYNKKDVEEYLVSRK